MGQTARNMNTIKDIPFFIIFFIVMLFFIGSGFISYNNTRIVKDNTATVVHTHEVIMSLSNMMGLIRDAETGQRGFIITGDEDYLEPYNNAIIKIKESHEDVKKRISDNPAQLIRLQKSNDYITRKLAELETTISLRRNKGYEAAKNVVITDRGQKEMDFLRTLIGEMQQEEKNLRAQRILIMEKSYRKAIISGIISAIAGVILAALVGYLTQRAANLRRRQEWIQAGQIGLANAAAGDQRIEELSENILKYLAEYLGALAGAFFVKNGSGFRRVTTYGVPENSKITEKFNFGDGLLGQAAKDGKTIFVNDVPENYLTVGSALGQATPKYLVISPTSAEDKVNAVFELGFLHPPAKITLTLLDQASELIGVVVRAAKYRSELQNLLEETQRQGEELQAQSEELRVSNEELEEQGRALKESQVRLEHQQAELEQSNAQLEEQTQQLEIQRDDLARSAADLQMKSNDLTRASQYKSDFLANMSHELRTPLNSSLILAKLLADNPQGNLSAEQIKFAQTIQSSGNDLLALINDILDLSKIEAGHMEINPESLPLEWLTRDLANIFEPIGNQKGIKYKALIQSDAPKSIEVDRQRLEQILKNLLSNAFKFTEKGQVELTVGQRQNGDVFFAVQDTGIGITPDNQKAIFDAFRQADGAISRRYGGTGLGLSISRELARLLGGHIELQSESGKGSTFTLLIPATYNKNYFVQSLPQDNLVATSSQNEESAAPAISMASRIQDDRATLVKSKNVILIVEDDESFARILYDLAHQMDFQCLIAGTAEEALTICKQYMPSAVVLDVGLPDNSGLSVLDRLKRDAKTRHIPVHVVSAGDYAATALSLGAVGYMLKPVKREELEKAFKGLETKFSSTMKRVLLVEDDQVQRESVMKLLETRSLETVAVGTAAECLERLKAETFDCMILDLSLPDSSGYMLLETLSKEQDYSFPPVIVYTGRSLSSVDEQRLRRYSKSIIIKGAKSPERLLDEVTLFLHQVVSDLPADKQKMLEKARNRDSILEGRRILIVEDDIRNVYAVTNIFEPLGAIIQIARNGREALEALEKSKNDPNKAINLVLMDVMMPEMDGLAATREIRKEKEWKKLPIIMLTAKAMRDDQERCMEAGANDYMAKPIDVEKLISLVRVWMPR